MVDLLKCFFITVLVFKNVNITLAVTSKFSMVLICFPYPI